MTRYRYGRFHGGPDPLADPIDVGQAIEDLSDEILDGQPVAEALSQLMRSGTDGRRGLDELRNRIQQRRRQLQKSGRLDGLLSDIAEMLDEAVQLERTALFPDPSDDARFREAQLDNLPSEPSRAVPELANYEWRSPEAREVYEQIKERLRTDIMDQQFRQMSQAVGDMGSPEAQQAMKEMLGDLNDMLDKHRRGEDVSQDFDAFMDKHGDLFPNRPESFEQLLDELARQAAAMQRLMDSLTPEQRHEMQGLMDAALGDLDLQSEMGRLNDSLRALRPDLPWTGRQRMTGGDPMGLPDATQALAELSDLDALSEQLGQDYPGASLDDIDEEAVERALGRQAVDDVKALRAMQRELERQGYLVRKGDRLELTPKAVRRLGKAALNRVFSSLEATTRGNHEVRRTGAAGELTGSTRAWQFGDEEAIDVVRTVGNAVQRRVLLGEGSTRLLAEDFEVRETETRTRAAVALLVDQSFSMVMNDTWRPAKTTAMALQALASSAFPLDALEIIAFANLARVVAPHELPDLEASSIQGTNLQHALMLAGQFLDRHRDADQIVMVVTDGEPTAHLERDGGWWFDWPPARETVASTVAEVDRMTARRIPISWFRLGDEHRLEVFLDEMARRNRGRVFAATGDQLGDYVVSDYVTSRRRGRR